MYEVTEEKTIAAKFEYNGILISSITLNKSSIKLNQGDTAGFQFEVTVQPENATNKEYEWEIVETDRQGFVTVSNTDRVTPTATGLKDNSLTLKCKAKYGTAQAICNINIVESGCYYIYTANDFLTFASDPNGEYYVMNNIDMTGKPFGMKTITFSGILDGQGKTISNLGFNAVKKPYASNTYYALVEGFEGIARNVLFKDVYIDGSGGRAVRSIRNNNRGCDN